LIDASVFAGASSGRLDAASYMLVHQRPAL